MYNNDNFEVSKKDWVNLHFRHKSLQDYYKRSEQDKYYAPRIPYRVGLAFRLVFVFLIIILFVGFFWRSRGSANPFTFSSFLHFLSTLNNVDVNFNISTFIIGGDWGAFNFFRNILNGFGSILGAVIWLGVNVVNVAVYLYQFISFLYFG